MLVVHLAIAFASLTATTYLLLRPSIARLRLSLGLVAGTLLSGTYLTLSHPSHLLEACAMGLVYSLGSCAAIVVANRKMLPSAR